MAIDINAPTFPESITDGTVSTWYKKVGESVKRDELIVDIETDKVVIEILAEADGVLGEILKKEGDTVLTNELLGHLNDSSNDVNDKQPSDSEEETVVSKESVAPEATSNDSTESIAAPSARKMAEEQGIQINSITGTGKGGRITKEDVVSVANTTVMNADVGDASTGDRVEKRVPMTRLRAKIAERLVEAQSSMAMLTTFNEVNMKPIMDLRSKYKELFEKKHDGVRLGFMSFFVKAATEALKRQPSVNASVDNNDVIYHGYQDIGVAVSSDRGLVVPILRNAEQMSLAEIEGAIMNYGKKAKEGKLAIEDMTGGTFTISNGGVFGSLLSTPIVNPPQAAILGMHKIQERPMAVNGEVVICPMMYLALSYDHRLIDGKEAVTFLVTIKDLLEDPARLLLEI
ncbi:UNVERIFIED_CONTAM: hypothetical protein GTU68_008589 [Idotea baltica]|nr:hypothetical protein [Idotea baltica]